MARKSRKPDRQTNKQDVLPSLIQVAVYIRLSMDERNHKGNSIENQQRIIENFIIENPDFELYDTYIDKGASGTNFERTNFQRMLLDAVEQRVDCIIIKDLSRLGRNVIETGYYTESLFPSLGVRLISVNDNFDSSTYTGDISLPLINLVNEAYALDISSKTKSHARQSMKDGVYVGGKPPYGYIRATDNRKKLVVDEAAAQNIRRVYAWALEGKTTNEIARSLNSEGDSRRWYARTIERILRNEIYTGRLIQGKSKSVNFQRQATGPDEWVCIDDAHEAIVAPEIFQAVQALRQELSKATKSSPTTIYSKNIFKGKVFCGDCGRPLERTKNHDKYIFRCITNKSAPGTCNGCRISEEALKAALIEQLLQYRDIVMGRLGQSYSEDEFRPELQFLEMEMARILDTSRTLYENLVQGIIDEWDYLELRSGYQDKLDGYKERNTELKRVLDDEKREEATLRKALHILNELAETDLLTQDCLDLLVERVGVGRDGSIHISFILS